MTRELRDFLSRCAAVLLSLVLFIGYASARDIATSAQKIKYEFELNDADRTKLFNGVTLLRYGDTIAQAKQLLGKPSSERDLRKLTFANALLGTEREYILHDLTYYVKRVLMKGATPADQAIYLDFDKDGHLFRITYSAMKPIAGEVTDQDIQPPQGIELYNTRPPMPNPPHGKSGDIIPNSPAAPNN